MKNAVEKISWDIAIPVLTNKHIARQIVLVFSLAILFVIIVLFLIELFSGGITWEFIAALFRIFLLLVSIITVITFLGVYLFMGNRYYYTFTLDPQNGIWEKPQQRQRKKNLIVNSLLLFGGLLTRNFSAAGSGALSQSRQEQFVAWKDINLVEYEPSSYTITLKNNKRTLMIVFCHPDNYQVVSEIIQAKVL